MHFIPYKKPVLLFCFFIIIGTNAFSQAADSLQKPLVCNIGSLPSIAFNPNTTALSIKAKHILDTIAQKLTVNPVCFLKVIGHRSDNHQQLNWDRVDVIRRYLSDKLGIMPGRLIQVYNQPGDINIVELSASNGK